jgi:hypothetical protein
MLLNIFYLIGLCIFVINILLLFRSKEALNSMEWLLLYRNAGRAPDKKRINYKLVIFWLCSSILSSIWLLGGIFTSDWQIFLFLSGINIGSNYLLAKNKGQVKINLSFIKSVILNLILASLLYSYYLKLFLH